VGCDVSTAFLLAELPEGVEIYVHPPSGWLPRNDEDVKALQEKKVWKLTHALYGLRRSPKLWADKLSSTLRTKFDFVRFKCRVVRSTDE